MKARRLDARASGCLLSLSKHSKQSADIAFSPGEISTKTSRCLRPSFAAEGGLELGRVEESTRRRLVSVSLWKNTLLCLVCDLGLEYKILVGFVVAGFFSPSF